MTTLARKPRSPCQNHSRPAPFRFYPGLRGVPLFCLVVLLLRTLIPPARAETVSPQPASVIVVVGAPGEPEYGSNFVREAQLWSNACSRAGCRELTLGLTPPGPTNDFELLKRALAAEPLAGSGQLWLVFLGHGTFDGSEARFNLRGPDISAEDLASWLRPFRRPLAFIDCSSASAPFLNKLSGTNRVIITATRSGNEQNYARFGLFLAEALLDPTADLDKDGQVSLLEAFLMASRRTADFYKVGGRLATEHALIDDNGDGLGTPAVWFRGLRLVKNACENAPVDGLLARQFCLVPSADDLKLTPEQRLRTAQLERAVFQLRAKKELMTEPDYYRALEQLLLPLAQLYQAQ